MVSERKKHLLDTMKNLNKSLGNEYLDFASQEKDVNLIPTGIEVLDKFIGGGFKEGVFSVIYGAESCGKSTLVLQTIAHAQSLGKTCCYIDLEHSFSKDRAEHLGVNLEELILVNKCQTAEDALNIIRGLCKEKVVDLFAIDSIQAMSPLNQQENKGKERQLEEKEIAELARLLSKFFQVVSPDVFRAKACVLMVGQVRIGGIGTFFTRATMTGGEAIKHFANIRLFLRKGQGADAPTEKIKKEIITPDGDKHYRTEHEAVGFDVVVKIEKSKSSLSAKENSEIHIPFYYTTGFKAPCLVETNTKPKEELEQAVISSTAIEGVKITKEDLSVNPGQNRKEAEYPEPKKKRGRPKKDK